MGAEQGIINYELSHAMAVLGFCLVLTAQDILPQSKCERENDTFRFEIPVNPGCNSNQQGGGIPWPHGSRFGDLSSLWKKRGMGLADKVV